MFLEESVPKEVQKGLVPGVWISVVPCPVRYTVCSGHGVWISVVPCPVRYTVCSGHGVWISKRSRNKEFGERGSKVLTERISKNSLSRSLKRSFGEKESSLRELCECGVKSVYRVYSQNRVLGGRI